MFINSNHFTCYILPSVGFGSRQLAIAGSLDDFPSEVLTLTGISLLARWLSCPSKLCCLVRLSWLSDWLVVLCRESALFSVRGLIAWQVQLKSAPDFYKQDAGMHTFASASSNEQSSIRIQVSVYCFHFQLALLLLICAHKKREGFFCRFWVVVCAWPSLSILIVIPEFIACFRCRRLVGELTCSSAYGSKRISSRRNLIKIKNRKEIKYIRGSQAKKEWTHNMEDFLMKLHTV